MIVNRNKYLKVVIIWNKKLIFVKKVFREKFKNYAIDVI